MKKDEEIKEESTKQETNWQEQFIRVSADFQNYKRRTEQDKVKWATYAQIKVVEAFLPLVDEIDLAITSSEKHDISDALQTWIDGFKMIQKNLEKKLADLGVKEIDCAGKFDPNLHEALMQVDSDEHQEGDIVSVLSKGYTLGDEVIRHAKVSVAR